MTSKISIIIPVYNAEKWLDRCLNSIIEQTYKNIEIILVNDGSSDKSLEICKEYKQIDKRIIIVNKKNEGASKARNDGLMIATGQYIQFVDSDDWLDLNACEVLINQYLSNQELDLVVCGLTITKDNVVLRTPHLATQLLEVKNNSDHFFELYKIFASPCNKLYKKKNIKKYFDTQFKMGEDLVFNLEYLMGLNKVKLIENCLYNVNLDNEESLNRKFEITRLENFLKVQKKVFEFCDISYGTNYNKTFVYNNSLLGVHSHFRNVCELFDKKNAKKIIKENLEINEINVATNNARFERKDYNIFKLLMRLKNTNAIYSFFKIKFLLLNINRTMKRVTLNNG